MFPCVQHTPLVVRMRALKTALIWVVSPVAVAAAPADAQNPVSRAPADSLAYGMEILTRERWMHGRQQSRFSPFGEERGRLLIDSIRSESSTRRYYLSIGNTAFGRDSALVVVGPSNREPEIRLGLATFKQLSFRYPGDSARFAKSRREQTGVAELRIRDLVPSLPPAAPRVGLSWRDTIAREASDGPYRRAFRGTRVSRITGETVVDGRRVWIVRDSANVHYEDARLEEERTVDTVFISRSASGTIRGVQFLDAALPLFLLREDTTALRGDATLRYPDGRTLRTPARYERMRSWKLYEPRAHAAYLAERRAAEARQYGGMVLVPSSSLERRLMENDVGARDSLIPEWRRTSDPNKAAEILRLLSWLRSESSRELVARVRIDAGDTAFLYQQLADRAFTAKSPPDSADVPAMLRFMEDPSIAWGFNLSRDWLYENLVQAMTTWPSAAQTSSDDRVACAPSACRLLAEQWRSAREPRLRDVGLVALFSMDPRRWADTVLALDLRRHPLLRPAKMLAMGTVATWQVASRPPMPPPNSDARAWLAWMNGGGRGLSFVEWHRTAIRMFALGTGRDIVGELQRSYHTATSDSARLVFGTMLRGLGALRLTEAELVEAFTSGVQTRIDLARGEVVASLSRSGTPMLPQHAALLIDRLIAAVVNSTPLWRDIIPNPGRSSVLPGMHGGSGRILFDSDSVPESVRASWAGRVEFISKSEWNRREPREGGMFYSPHPVVVWGRFARVRLTLSERIGTVAGSAPRAYAAGVTYYLMDLNGEWVIVASEGWIT